VNIKKVNKGIKKEAILLFPFWTGKLSAYSSLVKKLKEYDIFFCDYPNEVFSEDISLSKDCMQRILEDSSNLIKHLRKKGYKKIFLVGSSFGANLSVKLSTLVKVDKVVLNMPDRTLAREIFDSPALFLLKKRIENKGFKRKAIDKIYSFVSTEYLIHKIKNKIKIKFLIFSSTSDIFCTTHQFKPVLKKLNRNKIDYKLELNTFFGHVFGIYKNLWFNKKIVEFIKE